MEIVGGIVEDIVDRASSSSKGLKHEMCMSLLEELLKTRMEKRSKEGSQLCVMDEDVVML